VPPKPHKDQSAPKPVSPTGTSQPTPLFSPDPRAQSGEYLTTAQGLRLADTDHSLKAGPRGPVLLEDFHLREKITHFDHERIPERAVHARGAAAHGTFVANGAGASLCKAGFLAKGKETPVFTRFSTVLGSRGAADTARDVRGFAVKMYTDEGTWDLVGNNMPIFFVQDGIKFPDLVHAAKPSPDREIPQAATAHDGFWDFVSLHTEAMHQVIWAMSDRGLPRSFRTMEGFGIHTFRLVNAAGETCLVKFHWKPVAGVHSLVWEEAQLAAGCDPDYHRRDMADGIENGAFLEFDLGLQVMPDVAEELFGGIDLLDPTKLIPEELCPVQIVGRMTLDRNPTNYFAETEQVAFCTQNLVPGIQFTNDPLLAARNHSYLDTQISRLGGVNFTQLPINRPHAPVNDNHRDGMHQTAVHTGLAPYFPNTIDPDAPQLATDAEGAYITLPTLVEGEKVRAQPLSFDDHFTQATMFWLSLTDVERTHVVEAYTFELGKCFETPIRGRMLVNLARIHPDLVGLVAPGLGMAVPDAGPVAEVTPSPALSQVYAEPGPIAGRVIGVVAVPGADLAGIAVLRKALKAQGAVLRVVAPVGGFLGKGAKAEIVERTLLTTRSVEYDGIVLAGGTGTLEEPRLTVLLAEMFRHCKMIAAWGDGADALTAAHIDTNAPGIVLGPKADTTFTSALINTVGMHRAWDRATWLPEPAAP